MAENARRAAVKEARPTSTKKRRFLEDKKDNRPIACFHHRGSEVKDGDANDVESLQREELIGKVLPWFLDQLVQYDKDRSYCAEFAKVVFTDTFNNTEISTLEKKIKGKDRMQILIDTYREALSTNVKN